MKGPIVRADVTALLASINAGSLGQLETLSPEEAREVLAARRNGSLRPRGLPLVRDLTSPGPAGPTPLRLYDLRSERAHGPVIVFYHGGGFMLGGLDTHHDLCCDIAALTDLPVVSVGYRLAPEHPWPAAPDDAEAAARWIAGEGAAALGRRAEALVLAGDSAGANLAAVTAAALRDLPAGAPVAAQFLAYPTVGADRPTASREAFATGHFLTLSMLRWFEAHYGAPAGHPRYDLEAALPEGMPPTLLFTAELDPLRDDGRAYAAMLIRAGVPVVYHEAKGTVHGCLGMSDALPSSFKDLQASMRALMALLER